MIRTTIPWPCPRRIRSCSLMLRAAISQPLHIRAYLLNTSIHAFTARPQVCTWQRLATLLEWTVRLRPMLALIANKCHPSTVEIAGHESGTRYDCCYSRKASMHNRLEFREECYFYSQTYPTRVRQIKPCVYYLPSAQHRIKHTTCALSYFEAMHFETCGIV